MYEDNTEKFIVVGMDFTKEFMQTQRYITSTYIDFWNKTIDRFDYVGKYNKFMNTALQMITQSCQSIWNRPSSTPIVESMMNSLFGKKEEKI